MLQSTLWRVSGPVPREAKPLLLRQPALLEGGRFGWVWDVSLRWGSSQQAVGIRDGIKLLLQEPLEIDSFGAF